MDRHARRDTEGERGVTAPLSHPVPNVAVVECDSYSRFLGKPPRTLDFEGGGIGNPPRTREVHPLGRMKTLADMSAKW